MDKSTTDSWTILDQSPSIDSPDHQLLASPSGQFAQSVFVNKYGPSTLLQIGLRDVATCVSTKPFEGIKQVIFLVPGNPGVIGFYETTMRWLYEDTKIPIIGLGHPGLSNKLLTGVSGPMTIRKQVLHKLDFIENIIPKDVEIILIGHSIGAFMTMEIMKGIQDRDRIRHNILLMPAIHDLGGSIGAKFLRVFYFLRFFVYLGVFFLWLLPEKLIYRMVRGICSIFVKELDEPSMHAFMQLRSIRATCNSLSLADDELDQVTDRDDLLIRHNLSRFSFVYIAFDEWVPARQRDDLLENHPEADVTVVEGVVHAFMLDHRMTRKVIETLSSKLGLLKT